MAHSPDRYCVIHTFYNEEKKNKKEKRIYYFFLEGNHHLNILAQKNFLLSSAKQRICEKMYFLQNGGKQFLA